MAARVCLEVVGRNLNDTAASASLSSAGSICCTSYAKQDSSVATNLSVEEGQESLFGATREVAKSFLRLRIPNKPWKNGTSLTILTAPTEKKTGEESSVTTTSIQRGPEAPSVSDVGGWGGLQERGCRSRQLVSLALRVSTKKNETRRFFCTVLLGKEPGTKYFHEQRQYNSERHESSRRRRHGGLFSRAVSYGCRRETLLSFRYQKLYGTAQAQAFRCAEARGSTFWILKLQ